MTCKKGKPKPKIFTLVFCLMAGQLHAAGSTGSTAGQVVPINQGGTGGNTAAAARTNLAVAPLASPSFSGTVSVPTASAGDATTKAASTSFVDTYFAKKANPTFSGTANFAALSATGLFSSTGDLSTTGEVAIGSSVVSSAISLKVAPNNSLTGISQIGVLSNPTFGGTSTNYAIVSQPDIAAGVAASNATGQLVANATLGAGATLTNQFGLYIDPLTSATNNWTMYSPGNQSLYHNGRLMLGTLTPSQGTKLLAYDASIPGGSPATIGSTDANVLARFGAGSVSADLGFYATGDTWLQTRTIGNNALNHDFYINPNGGSTVLYKALVGGPTASGGNTFNVIGDGTSTPIIAFSDIRTGATPDTLVAFVRNGSVVGSISTTNVATAYNTSSDFVLKEDFKDFSGISLLKKLHPVDFQWKSSKTRDYGFIAQEVYNVLPTVVTPGTASTHWSMDYGKLTPVLAAALQEQQREIEILQIAICILGLFLVLSLLGKRHG